jgi:hypothetical protein
MMDSRFHLEVKFSVYGKDFEWSPSLNWFAEPGECDERISAWFAARYEEAYAEFNEASIAAEAERQAAEAERRERVELARLQAKYG